MVVGMAGNHSEAMARFKELQPDVSLVDVRLGEDSGIQLVREMRGSHPDARILMLSSSDLGGDIRDALEAGAAGYLLKNAGPGEFFSAIRLVAEEGRYLPGELKPMLAEALAEEPLTPAETEVLRALTRGLSNHDIAQVIGRSHDTVKAHLKDVFRKIGAGNRAEAVTIAGRRGLLVPR